MSEEHTHADDVLRAINGNSLSAAHGEDDLAIAKALQDQERMFLMLSRNSRAAQNEVENAGEENRGSVFRAPVEAVPASVPEPHQPEGSERASSAHQSGSDAENDDSAAADELEDDEALARRLQEEEQQLHYERMMQLAGGFGGSGDEDYGEDEYLTDDSVDPDNMTYEELRALGDAVGTVSKGLPKAVIDALPTAKLAPLAEGAATSTDDEQCAVCRMEFEAGEDVTTLPCKHFYHPPCISQWLQINKVCPICNQEIEAPSGTLPKRSSSAR